MNKKSLIAPVLISLFSFIAVPVSVSAVTQRASEINVCVDWTTKEIKYSKFWEKCPAKHTAMTLGSEGSSAYDVAVANGFVGTVDQWLASLAGKNGSSSSGSRGPAGADGANGTNGTDGADGETGPAGERGPAGSAGTFFYNAWISRYGFDNVTETRLFTTNEGRGVWYAGSLVLHPGTYKLALTADIDTRKETDVPGGDDSNYRDQCTFLTVTVDASDPTNQALWTSAAQITVVQNDTTYRVISDRRVTNAEFYVPLGSGGGKAGWNMHHSLSTVFQVDSVLDTTVVVACSTNLNAERGNSYFWGNISAMQIADGMVSP